MPNVIIIEQAQYLRMPWKNGLGETLEIQRNEDENGLRFRISQASVVEDGVFSDFSGLHRTLVLLSGDGMTLEHSGRNTAQDSRHIHVLSKTLDMARFCGGDETHATLKNGKIEDLNIMVRETDTQANVEACAAPCSLLFSNDGTLLCGFYASEESLLEIDDADAVTINAHSMVVFSPNTTARLTKGLGVFVRISELNHRPKCPNN
ncbi:HutD family protein [Marinomonas sp. M1K-6]|uniref:HutD family protein n=1 Tax=Marinomonas profundi TaxID=2726122 RepID=A0A847R972_9GAMM|nr:HutD family protein [Marinomonas profundi]NLQ17727.1 HutD family protein [Marinomonas profundi]UDV04284.1 HutD family protein [Marinomonas profundi]